MKNSFGNSLVYCVAPYEPQTPEEIQSASELLSTLLKNRMETFAVIDNTAAYDALSESLRIATFSVDLPYIQSLLSGGPRTSGRREWIYWDTTGGAKTNRLDAGFVLWKTGLDGAFLPLPANTDFSTIQWAAIREGIDDTRYITTMMDALRDIKDALKVGGTKNVTAAKKTADDAEAYLNAALAKPLKDMKNQDYQDIRAKVAGYAIALQGLKK
jgi:hypothetical protein